MRLLPAHFSSPSPARRPFIARAALALTLTATGAGVGAASSVPMEVSVTMTPAACTPTLSGGGVADYGLMNAAILKPGQITALPAISMVFSVNCDAAAKFSVLVIDNRTASVVPGLVAMGSGNGALGDDYNFGLGSSAGRSVGGYSIRFVTGSYTGDYQPALLMSSPDGLNWTSAANNAVSKRLQYSWGTGGATTEAYRALSGSLSVQPYVNKPENLSLSNDVVLDGSATLELHYL
ncbi:DUF1120 domain-containing protein [Herbaspirillum sp. LeCh32-8]|uniref:DUF1120 domain-containing protein n=1 Tax=Herbaspirillum sp. LeCh32-8 TaxID=2821356 RepID=UPI001AE613C7|nr:DUF1120 domain-containing protein [Herbaspirillum sp. LeCh32-8]MBP0596593.1 DUF1120 domain-containing protein [Herbaspirillum sp. LeCh32-8]